MPCFNTQPPEGGWVTRFKTCMFGSSFNTQPPEGGWASSQNIPTSQVVSTHSRPKAAGFAVLSLLGFHEVSTHSRPKAAGPSFLLRHSTISVSTHSRPKAAGIIGNQWITGEQGFNTQPPEGGWVAYSRSLSRRGLWFQHTAARRRLVSPTFALSANDCFNTQPPEGGWI